VTGYSSSTTHDRRGACRRQRSGAGARALYARICASAPRYDITEFLRTFLFRMQSDIRQIRDAFVVMQSRSS
jgi:hypothetical protein